MYRHADLRQFAFVSALSNVLILISFSLMFMYHFYQTRIIYRDVAFIALALSLFLRFQMIMHKVEIMERRLISLSHEEVPGGRFGASVNYLGLIFTCLFFGSAWFF